MIHRGCLSYLFLKEVDSRNFRRIGWMLLSFDTLEDVARKTRRKSIQRGQSRAHIRSSNGMSDQVKPDLSHSGSTLLDGVVNPWLSCLGCQRAWQAQRIWELEWGGVLWPLKLNIYLEKIFDKGRKSSPWNPVLNPAENAFERCRPAKCHTGHVLTREIVIYYLEMQRTLKHCKNGMEIHYWISCWQRPFTCRKCIHETCSAQNWGSPSWDSSQWTHRTAKRASNSLRGEGLGHLCLRLVLLQCLWGSVWDCPSLWPMSRMSTWTWWMLQEWKKCKFIGIQYLTCMLIFSTAVLSKEAIRQPIRT